MTTTTDQTVTGIKTFGTTGNTGKLVVSGNSSGTTTIAAQPNASGIVTLPATTDVLVGRATVDNLTNKTISNSVIIGSVVALTDAANITTDVSLGNTFSVTVNGNRTLAIPSNPTGGQKCIWIVKQGAGGNHTVTLNTSSGGFRLGTDITDITFSTTASASDYLGAIYNGVDNYWDVLAFVRGFS
jgi:hypothetical protein